MQSREVPHEGIVAEVVDRGPAYETAVPGNPHGGLLERDPDPSIRTDPSDLVQVALGERSYDIVIGRGLIASLGARIAALRPAPGGGRHRRNGRAHQLAAARRRSIRPGIERQPVIVPPGEASKSFRVVRERSARRSSPRASNAATW